MKKSFAVFIVLGSGFIFLLSSQNILAQSSQREQSLRYFDQAAKVFQHPRCLNCHPAGDRPLQGMDMHEHLMNVQRGPKDHGATALNCNACHGTENNKYSQVPGAPHWQLAPRQMGWVGLSKKQLCQKLKAGTQPGRMAGDMTPEEFIKHNAEDKLVAWGWSPGERREPVPFTQKKFGDIVAQWIATGAECPD